MTEDEKLRLNLSEKLLKLVLNEKIPVEKKIGNMDYLIRLGADVNAKFYGKSLAFWVKELGDENLIKYVEKKGGVEFRTSKERAKELGYQFWDDDGNIKSVKEIKELVLMGADLSVRNDYDEPIWKNLSFEEMNEVLKDLPNRYVIDGDVYLVNLNLTKLPYFSKIKVGGDFVCSSNQLTSLEGAPSEVGGSFYCYNNQLTDLKGASIDVGGDFDCSYNQLTDLKGAPEKVGGDFYCYNNQLTDLKGAPSVVGGDFYCRENQLTSLEGAPSVVGGGFYCRENQLTTLKGAPSKVGGDFDCYENQLTTLQGAPSEVGGDFYCSGNQLKDLKGAPSVVGGRFVCGWNQLTSLEGAPREVGGDFICSVNQLTTLEGKPLKIGGEFKIEDEVLARIEEAEKKKKMNNAVMGAMADKFEM